jgi:Polyketide cyclase / dehydrase and lipid transport
MAAIIENSIEIARTQDAVFDYLVDLRNEVHWNPDCVSAEKLTTGPVGVGTRFRAKWKQGPVIEAQCTRFERPRMWQYENGGPISLVLTITLEPTTSGGTRLTSRGEWTPHGWFRLAFPVFIRMMRRAERGVVANAGRALEEGRDALVGEVGAVAV